MPLLSLITPVHRDRGHHLDETAASIAAQSLPSGWEVEWLVQEDGFEPRLREHVEALDFPAAHHAVGRQMGPATQRSVALHRASGDLVTCIDEDDIYLPDALRWLLTTSVATGAAWVGSGFQRFDDTGLLGDPVMPLLPDGPVEPGTVVDHWRAHDVFPVLATQVIYRRQALIEVGGWPTVPRSEDAALLALVSTLHTGYALHHATLLYRQHAGQNTKQSWADAIKPLAKDMTLAYVDALAARVPVG